jgi:transcriptional regulator NrdR family protein
MAQQVVKRDGSKEPFDAEKIKKAIGSAAGRTALTPERVAEVVKQVSDVVLQFAADKEEVSSSELREKALTELDKLEPSVAESWRKYDQEQGRI